MPSFDTVSEANMEEVKNAITQTNKVVTNRFDLKGTSAKVELKDKEREITIFGDSDFHLDQIMIEVTKKIVKVIKDSKMKVQASIQGDAVRVTGAKRDDLQAAMAMLRKEIKDLPLEFNNFRD